MSAAAKRFQHDPAFADAFIDEVGESFLAGNISTARTMLRDLVLPRTEPVAILTAADVAEIEDALRSTGRHNRLAYALRRRLGKTPP
jgi:hypothetical protein